MTGLPRVGCFYTVTPGLGDDGAEWFPDTLAGLAGKQGALARAMHASVGGVIQQVTVTRGRVATVIRTYKDGKPIRLFLGPVVDDRLFDKIYEGLELINVQEPDLPGTYPQVPAEHS